MRFFGSERAPWRLFVLLGLVFGMAIVVLQPPFVGADESAHFLRAYQVSCLGWIPEKIVDKDGVRLGGTLPTSLESTIGAIHSRYPLDPDNKLGAKDFARLWDIKLHPERRAFCDFPATATYPAIPYLPQSIGIFLGRMAGFPPVAIMYLGRLCNLLAYLALVVLALRTTPILKWAFFLVGLMPMALLQA
jgi:hypothetical protein